jgi:hypothetical protein
MAALIPNYFREKKIKNNQKDFALFNAFTMLVRVKPFAMLHYRKAVADNVPAY